LTLRGSPGYNLGMKRASNRKAVERRKRSRGKSASPYGKPSKASSRVPAERPRVGAQAEKDTCQNCSKFLEESDRALFVEEEIGRIFCSESCIAGYFSPEIARLEKEYFRRLSPRDLSGDERESLAHLRWITLQEPDEIWREKTLTGDFRFTLISEFQPENKRIWCICICLFLRGEPSFLYLAFPTRNAAMVNHYRKGERVELKSRESKGVRHGVSGVSGEENVAPIKQIDGLAEAWTEEETLRAQLVQERRSDDIPTHEYVLYQSCFEETLDSPDEIWSRHTKDSMGLKLFHFIRYYSEEKPGVWYVIVAKETDDQEEIEILESFPTHDSNLVDRYRRGRQELGLTSLGTVPMHVVH